MGEDGGVRMQCLGFMDVLYPYTVAAAWPYGEGRYAYFQCSTDGSAV